MLTATVRDLHLSHPGKYITNVETSCPDIWINNPYLTRIKAHEAKAIVMHYPLINDSNEGSLHFIHGFRTYLEETLEIKIKPTKFWGDIHFSRSEQSAPSLIHKHFTGWDSPYWLISTGGKSDFTAKWWIPEYAQEVVDYFKNRIQFVQFGGQGPNHVHPPLRGVINVVGKTDIRMLIQLMYHSCGVICPVTFAMHLAAAIPAKPGYPKRKPCIVTAGGREPSNYEAYTNHIYIHANGQLDCCDNGGCWKSRTVPLGDGDKNDKSLCTQLVPFRKRQVQKCMRDLVTANDVIRAVERYHSGGLVRYLPPSMKTIEANW